MSKPFDFQLLFAQSPEVLLVLAPDAPRYTMVAATNSRLRVTHCTAETLGRGLFEVFPDNPDDPDADGTSNLRASLDRVLRSRQADTMPVQRYDIRGPDGAFQARYWSPKNIPVLGPRGEVAHILHRVEDVTDLVRASEMGEALRGRTRDMEREVLSRSRELAAAIGELREANGKLAELDAAKTVFCSGALAEGSSSCVHALRLLRAAGMQVAIDDFGTGFSSLGRLSELPIDTLKIDRTFTSRLPGNRNSCTLVSTIISLAHAFEMSTVAEGVETRAQFEHLRLAGCDESQGYFHSQPLPAAQLEAWLRQHASPQAKRDAVASRSTVV